MRINSVQIGPNVAFGTIKNRNFRQFISSKILGRDTFEKRNGEECLKNVDLEGENGKKIKAQMYKKEGPTETSIKLKQGKRELGSCTIKNENYKFVDGYYVSELNNYTNDDKYYFPRVKNVGTELLKQAVIESKLGGHQGKLNLLAMHIKPPFVFYYKNNLRAKEQAKALNAPIAYCAKNNIPYSKFGENSGAFMFLNKEGANALLDGKRICANDKFETIATKKIKTTGGNAELEGIFLNDGFDDKYIMVIEKKNGGLIENFFLKNDEIEEKKQFAIAGCISIEDDTDDKKGAMVLSNLFEYNATKEDMDFLIDCAHKKAKELGKRLDIERKDIQEFLT